MDIDQPLTALRMGSAAEYLDSGCGEWDFAPAIKISELSHRTASAGETLSKLGKYAHRIPITRLSDLTPLDRLRLPVFSATTPLARDLSTHMGKGLDRESAQVSAMMEAVERVSAERIERPTKRRSYSQMKDEVRHVQDPRLCDLPEDSTFSEHRSISWIEAWDLVGQQTVWIPLDLAINPPAEGVLRRVDTNGLAAGSTLLEAVVHGLCEAIERDALGLSLFRSTLLDLEEGPAHSRRIDHRSLDEYCGDWLSGIAAAGFQLHCEIMDSEIGVPVFRSLLVDHSFPTGGDDSTRVFVGVGASPNATTAAIRSITESVQSRLALVQGARDSFNTLSPPWRPSPLTPHLRDLESHATVPLSSVASLTTNDLLEDLRHLVQRLTEASFERILVVNLSRLDFGFPVVRVRVPGLTSFAVDRARLGWRCLRYLL